MPGAVFGYHSQNCGGRDYGDNDHCAFARDLAAVRDHGLPIVSLGEIARCVATQAFDALPERFVAFTCDDGSLLDWRDYEHPVSGPQRSFAAILRDFLAARGLGGRHLLTSFVIASPEARRAIDAGCYAGSALSTEDWWAEAAAEGLLAIENHSWDHVHECLPPALAQHGSPGDFHSVDRYARADRQVRAAAAYIDARLDGSGHRTSLFAYPYGHASPYLVQTYFPGYRKEHGMVGAVTTERDFVTGTSNPYALPRMICGDAWRSAEEFDAILQRLLALPPDDAGAS